MKRLAAILLTAGLGLAAGGVQAQISGRGGPMDVSANRVELIDAEHVAIWTGAVEALQGGNRLRAEQVRIYFAGKGGPSSGAPGRDWGAVQRIEASGTVFFVTPQQTARGNNALYNINDDNVVLTGDVIVAQGQSVVRGDRLVVDLKTNRATMGSTATGRNASGRVRGVFYPNGSGANPLGAPAPRKQ